MEALTYVVELLHSGGFSCVICNGSQVLTSQKSGIAPLLEQVESGEVLRGASVADKVIGRAAAMLLLLGGAKAVYADVMSASAKALLSNAGLTVRYGELTKYIVNRRGDDQCPMEQAVASLTDPKDAPAALHAAIERLKKA